jgi:hypothetical protein
MENTQQLRQHGAVVAVGTEQLKPKGQRGFVTFADGTTHRFESVREAEAFARAAAEDRRANDLDFAELLRALT